jgi:hypothetical protein
MRIISQLQLISLLAFGAHATQLSIGLSYYNGPSIGLAMKTGQIRTCADIVYTNKYDEMEAYNYDYTSLIKTKASTNQLGGRISSNWVFDLKKVDFEIGPLLGYDRLWFQTLARIPNSNNTILITDSTIVFDQYRAGIYAGFIMRIYKRFSVLLGTSFGYIGGNNVNVTYLVKSSFSRFDILDTKLGICIDLLKQ